MSPIILTLRSLRARMRSSAVAFGLIVLAISAAALVGPAFAQPAPSAPASASPTTPTRARLDSIKLQLDQVEAALTRSDLDQRTLQSLREQVEPLAAGIAAVINEQTPRLDIVKQRLDQLGPKPDDKSPPESPEVARDRADREGAVRDVDETIKLGRALLVQADQVAAEINDRRRALFASQLFQRSSPWLWADVAQSAPRDFAALQTVFGDWFSSIPDRLTLRTAGLALLTLVVVALIAGPGRRLISRFGRRDPNLASPTPFQKALAALLHALKDTAAAVLLAAILYLFLIDTGLVPPRIERILFTLCGGLAAWGAVRALTDAYFAPGLPAWRISGADDRVAHNLSKLASNAFLVLVLGKTVDTVNQAIGAGFSLTIATKAIFALILAVQIWIGLNGVKRELPSEQLADLGPFVPPPSDAFGPLRIGLAVVLAVMVCAVLAGYIAFASFLGDQLAWILAVGITLALLLNLSEEFLAHELTETNPVTRLLIEGIGIRRRSLDQFAVLASGAVRIVLIVVTIMLVIAPWGVESSDLVSSLRAALFGFTVGGVTISLSSIAIGLLVFGLGLTVTRAVQSWLDDKFLPRTELDSGLRNSIKTGLGYLGFILAGAIAISSIGLSLEKVTIVAGALSVGIGFGLQSIVNNFVSGLILLWERPIRVGDWILVGDEQGYVRRINVRSTEIETFDRSTVIVPNSNLVSGVVKNKVHNDKTGRVLIPLSVPRVADPDQVMKILLETAASHRDVMKEPAPNVLFKKIGDTALDFELICYVANIERGARVSSDLLFTILRELRKADIGTPGTPRQIVEWADVERIERAVDGLADAVGSRQSRGNGSEPGTQPSRPAAKRAAAERPSTQQSAPKDKKRAEKA